MIDAVRLAVGTLTRFPVPPPRRIDARVAGAAMLLAPVLAGALALGVGALVQAGHDALPASATPLLLAALAITVIAYLTRALHLDGLADTMDALGSGRPAEQALAIARRPDIGPFGVTGLVLVLLVQAAAYAGSVEADNALAALVAAAIGSRLALMIACARGIPPARADGLGAAVAGSVPVGAVVATCLGWVTLLAAVAWLVDPGWVVPVAAAVVAALAAGALALAVCVRRLGGVTGDVLGAVVEAAFAAALVAAAVVPR